MGACEIMFQAIALISSGSGGFRNLFAWDMVQAQMSEYK